MTTKISVQTRNNSKESFTTESWIEAFNSPLNNHYDLDQYQVASLFDHKGDNAHTNIRIRNPRGLGGILAEEPLWRIIEQLGKEPQSQRVTFCELIQLMPGQKLILRRFPQEENSLDQLVIACDPNPPVSL